LTKANIALIHVTAGLNDLYRVIVALVGENKLEAFDRSQERLGRQDGVTV
jgi:hypothetical protein